MTPTHRVHIHRHNREMTYQGECETLDVTEDELAHLLTTHEPLELPPKNKPQHNDAYGRRISYTITAMHFQWDPDVVPQEVKEKYADLWRGLDEVTYQSRSMEAHTIAREGCCEICVDTMPGVERDMDYFPDEDQYVDFDDDDGF